MLVHQRVTSDPVDVWDGAGQAIGIFLLLRYVSNC